MKWVAVLVCGDAGVMAGDSKQSKELVGMKRGLAFTVAFDIFVSRSCARNGNIRRLDTQHNVPWHATKREMV